MLGLRLNHVNKSGLRKQREIKQDELYTIELAPYNLNLSHWELSLNHVSDIVKFMKRRQCKLSLSKIYEAKNSHPYRNRWKEGQFYKVFFDASTCFPNIIKPRDEVCVVHNLRWVAALADDWKLTALWCTKPTRQFLNKKNEAWCCSSIYFYFIDWLPHNRSYRRLHHTRSRSYRIWWWVVGGLCEHLQPCLQPGPEGVALLLWGPRNRKGKCNMAPIRVLSCHPKKSKRCVLCMSR